MILENYYCCFVDAVPIKICDHILNYATYLKNKNKEKLGFIQNISEETINKNPEIKNSLFKNRNSNVIWMNEPWIYKEIQPFVIEANKKCNWNFDWEWSEELQFTKYGPGQFYNWHQDSFEKNKNRNGKIMNRKLSVTLSLSNYDEYEGGQLEFDFLNKGRGVSNINICKEVKTKGSLVVFPSFLWHRVTPVTKGIRYSLVMWNNGISWK